MTTRNKALDRYIPYGKGLLALFIVLFLLVLVGRDQERSEAQYSEGVSLIEKEEWEAATYELAGLSARNHADAKELYAYVNARHMYLWSGMPRPDVAARYLNKIPETYLGPYNEEMRQFRQQVEREIEQDRGTPANIHGPRPRRLSWDGSYTEVTRYLKDRARNPSSVKIEGCTVETSMELTDKGWLVLCNWSAENGFGGTNRESSYFFISNKEVVAMVAADRI